MPDSAGGRVLRAAVNYNWGPGGPTGVGVCTDDFSVRWVKTQSFADGTYTFTVTADDGVRVYLDGSLVIDQWKDQPPTTYTGLEVGERRRPHGQRRVLRTHRGRRGQAGDLAVDVVEAL